METLKEQYENTISKRESLLAQMKTLEEDEAVKRYSALRDQDKELASQQRKLYQEIKNEEYSSCSHIWVTTLRDYDRLEGCTYDYCGCVKCGLDSQVFYLMGQHHDINRLTPGQQIMYQFMRNGQVYERGIYTHIPCDLALASSIYSKIKEAHPDIDDETAAKYFEEAFANTGNKEDTAKIMGKRLLSDTEFNNQPK